MTHEKRPRPAKSKPPEIPKKGTVRTHKYGRRYKVYVR